MIINGQQKKKLQEALIDAFPTKSSLEQMLLFELEKKLDNLAGGNNLEEIVFTLIKVAESQGWIEDLVRAALKSNPRNPKLKSTAEELLRPKITVISKIPYNSDESLSSNNILRQNPNKFTVRIRHINKNETIGTGFILSQEGHIITCYHVVQEAIEENRVTQGVEVRVYFPHLLNGETKCRRAKVKAFFDDDDVVLLQLIGEPPTLSCDSVAVLGTATLSQGNEFMSYGYRTLDQTLSGWVEGKIMGPVEHSQGRYLKANPIELRTRDIRPGCSGAAVLDLERNLVVGIIRRHWNPKDSPVNDNIGWAIDTQVLTFDPINLPVQDAPLALRPAPLPKTNFEEINLEPILHPNIMLNSVPPLLTEWVGREELLKLVDDDWADSERRITGLIGFGGEGKTSFARKWLENLLQDQSQTQPQGVFWWSFYDKRNTDEFFETALTCLGRGRFDLRQFSSNNARVLLITALLSTGRYLFILDGLEVLQHEKGDNYGLLNRTDMREFLGYFAALQHESFCLITSRAPVLNLIDYTTYTQRDLERLSFSEGCALLQNLGVQGSNTALKQVVQTWDGHALTLSLLGAYLVDFFDGDVAHIRDIPNPSLDEPLYERVSRVLRRYDEHLTEAERTFLILFSAFRTPVKEAVLERILRQESSDAKAIQSLINRLSNVEFKTVIECLLKYRLLSYNQQTKEFTTHPLIRTHYFECLNTKEQDRVRAFHILIAVYYFIVGRNPDFDSTLTDLTPLIEAVHHACCVGAYEQGFNFWQEGFRKNGKFTLIHNLGNFETELKLLQEFFPEGDVFREPQVSDLSDQRFILNSVGFCLMSLGRLGEVLPFFERASQMEISLEDWGNASITYYNISDLYANLGKLKDSAEAAFTAVQLAGLGMRTDAFIFAQAKLAWAYHQCGSVEEADKVFKQAEEYERRNTPNIVYLYGQRGVRHSDHLRRLGNVVYARQITEDNLAFCELYRFVPDYSQCHRAMADLEADARQHDKACQHYNEALKIARSISRRDVLIEALLARGRWAARRGEVETAHSDLDEALSYVVTSGYRIYEADIRVGMAWLYLAESNLLAARSEAEKAQRMSKEMGYYWGQLDAAEIIAKLD